MHVLAHTNICIHTYTHTYIHTYIHVRTLSAGVPLAGFAVTPNQEYMVAADVKDSRLIVWDFATGRRAGGTPRACVRACCVRMFACVITNE
jgi:hypothetical protein